MTAPNELATLRAALADAQRERDEARDAVQPAIDKQAMTVACEENERLRSESAQFAAERDEARRHDGAIEEMLTGTQNECRALRAERDEAKSRLRFIGGLVGNIDEATMHHAVRRMAHDAERAGALCIERDEARRERDTIAARLAEEQAGARLLANEIANCRADLAASEIARVAAERDAARASEELARIQRLPELPWAEVSAAIMQRLSTLARAGWQSDAKALVEVLDKGKTYVSRLLSRADAAESAHARAAAGEATMRAALDDLSHVSNRIVLTVPPWDNAHAGELIRATGAALAALSADPGEWLAARDARVRREALASLVFAHEVEDSPRGWAPKEWLTLNGKRVTDVEYPAELSEALNAELRALAPQPTETSDHDAWCVCDGCRRATQDAAKESGF